MINFLEAIDNIIELMGLKNDAKDLSQQKSMGRKALLVAVIVSATALLLDFISITGELLSQEFELLGLSFSAIPILGAISALIISGLSLQNMREIYNNSQLTTEQKMYFFAKEALKFIVQVTVATLLIGLLAFPPTAVPLLTVILALSVGHFAFSIGLRIQEKHRQHLLDQQNSFTRLSSVSVNSLGSQLSRQNSVDSTFDNQGSQLSTQNSVDSTFDNRGSQLSRQNSVVSTSATLRISGSSALSSFSTDTAHPTQYPNRYSHLTDSTTNHSNQANTRDTP